MLLRLMQQPDCQQRRQRQQHTPVGHITDRPKDRLDRRELPEAGCDPIQDVARPHAHRRLGIVGAALAFAD